MASSVVVVDVRRRLKQRRPSPANHHCTPSELHPLPSTLSKEQDVRCHSVLARSDSDERGKAFGEEPITRWSCTSPGRPLPSSQIHCTRVFSIQWQALRKRKHCFAGTA
eukprot:6194519-Pleurochrysis_carterae.AAC.1